MAYDFLDFWLDFIGNSQNRLIRVTAQSGQQVNVEEYRYDYAGNRIAKISELSTTLHHHNQI